MRVVIDTNILVSAQIVVSGNTATIVDAWLDGEFTLLMSSEQGDELLATLNKPKIAALIKPHRAGRLVNQIRKLAEDVGRLPNVQRSKDPEDDFLLAMCEAGRADYLVTGDKSRLLALASHKNTKIITAREFVRLFKFTSSGPSRKGDAIE